MARSEMLCGAGAMLLNVRYSNVALCFEGMERKSGGSKAAAHGTYMTVQTILKMGDSRLLQVAKPVTEFDTDALHLLLKDLLDTMHAANGAGLAAPQIGVDLQVVVFGSGQPNPRYPDAPIVPITVLINPVITPIGEQELLDWDDGYG